MNVLVVPTIRESCIRDFLAQWKREPWDAIVVVEDNHERTFAIRGQAGATLLDRAAGKPRLHHLCWQDIDAELGQDRWIISRRDSAIRSFGFWYAHRLGATTIFTLDDDCLPTGPDYFCERHADNLQRTRRWTESVPGTRTRGLPYQNLGRLDSVKVSMGLWSGVPDFDAVQTLGGAGGIELPRHPRIMPAGQFFPLCGMNLAFAREAAVLMYFPLMGRGSPFARFDDIWAGVICQKICAHLRWHIAVGAPCIYHSRASKPLANLVAEAPGIQFHEEFWEIIHSAPLSAKTARGCVRELGQALVGHRIEYVSRLGHALCIWAELFGDSEETREPAFADSCRLAPDSCSCREDP